MAAPPGHVLHLLAALCLRPAGAAAAGSMMKGINYGVAPTASGISPNDDFMCDDAAPLWSRTGRGDLEVMRAMGANTVRLYGNDPRASHRGFLDAAHDLGLEVMPGNSDWPYTQSPRNCMEHTDYDCSSQVKRSYQQNLQRGFLLDGGEYHPALGYVVAINEPELKLPNVGHPVEFCRAVVSALDGMLEAEKEVNAHGKMPKFTVTFSFALCPKCGKWGDKPALGQMWQLRDAMLNPEKYGYKPKNDLAALFRTRFVNSFNTHNPASDIRPLILDAYEVEFPDTPIFVAEYHSPVAAKQQDDVETMLRLVESSPLLLGLSYFEYLKREDLDHNDFGLFSLGEEAVTNMRYFGKDYSVTCVRPAKDADGSSLPAQVARAFRGSAEADLVLHPSRCITGSMATSSTTTTSSVTATTTTTTSATSTSTSSSTTTTSSATSTTTSTTATTTTVTSSTTTATTTTGTRTSSTSTSALRGGAGRSAAPRAAAAPAAWLLHAALLASAALALPRPRR